MKPIYMDNNATTACDPAVVEAMLPFFTEQFGNASSIHSFGSQVGKALKEARVRVQTLLGAAHDSEIVFNSCGTESDSTAILSAIKAQPERKTIITTVVEHPAILTLCDQLEKEGYVVHKLRVNKKGRVDLDEYKSLLNDRVAIVSVMWANNETGTIFPVEEMAEMAHEKGIMFHTDAVQAVGKLPIDLKATKIDMLSLSGHKLHAPKGIGALYIRKGVRIRSFMLGGAQERKQRAGTENLASIVGLGAAIELAVKNMDEVSEKVTALRDHLISRLLAEIPYTRLNGHPTKRLPGNANFSFDYIEGEGLLMHMSMRGVAASTGSACSSASLEPSHVLLAIGLKHETAHGSFRATLGKTTTKEDIDYTVEALKSVVKMLREMSPLYEETKGDKCNVQ